MTSSFIDRLEDGPVKDWHLKYSHPWDLMLLASSFEKDGYTLDPKSGLFFRQIFSEEIIQKIGKTMIDIGLIRPTDLHYHEDVSEAVKVLDGEGFVYKHGGGVREFKTGDESYIHSRLLHAFSPRRNGHMEVRVVCSGILDPEKEHQVERFDEFKHWKEMFM